VGGGSGAGKTTVTRILAKRFGARLYSTDAVIGVHSDLLEPTVAPLLSRFRRMDMDERWLHRDPMTMYRTFPWFHGEGFDLILDDLRDMPNDRPVLVEGFRLLPQLVRPQLSHPRDAMWLLPTSDFRRAAFARRDPTAAFWLRTSDPDRALANLLERDRIFTDAIARDSIRAGVDVIHIDGTQTLDDFAVGGAGSANSRLVVVVTGRSACQSGAAGSRAAVDSSARLRACARRRWVPAAHSASKRASPNARLLVSTWASRNGCSTRHRVTPSTSRR
jgi:hypothetical protein